MIGSPEWRDEKWAELDRQVAKVKAELGAEEVVIVAVYGQGSAMAVLDAGDVQMKRSMFFGALAKTYT